MNAYKTTLINLAFKDPDFHGFKWVLKIITRKTYPNLMVIKIEKDLIVSTDGNRLHVYYPGEIFPSGTYKVLIKTRTQIILEKVTGISYPNWHSFFSLKGSLGTMTLRIDSVGYTELVRQMRPNETLDFNFFSDLDSEMTKASISTKSGEGIFFENFNGSMKALIMPMRV